MKYSIHIIHNEPLWLLPERAIYWADRQILLVSDLHLGKASHFRKSGLYVPDSVLQKDLDTLESLINTYPVKRVIVLGDLFHSKENGEWKLFTDWLCKHDGLHFELVKGNHDILPANLYTDCGILVHPLQLSEPPFLLSHHPVNDTKENGEYVLCGHIHPAIQLQGKGKQSMRLPCFYFGKKQGLLPAFGSFTGNEIMEMDNKVNIFVIAGDSVMEVKASND